MADPSPDPLTFEQALAELESVVRALEDGDTGLEESLARYERGVSLLKQCYAKLRDAEQRILVLTGEGEDGEPQTRPFEHAATLDGAQPEPRRRRKKAEE
jgi:exodeoxyribonuclease VII small subunit